MPMRVSSVRHRHALRLALATTLAVSALPLLLSTSGADDSLFLSARPEDPPAWAEMTSLPAEALPVGPGQASASPIPVLAVASATRRTDPRPPSSAVTGAGIPSVAMAAYQRAASVLGQVDPSCGLRWSLLAAIGRVESDHGRYGGSTLDEDGLTTPSILGPVLDGVGPVAAVRDTDAGRWDGDAVWDRAVGPMQFIPGTWAVAGADGDGDGIRSPHDIDDAALAAAVYLCFRGSGLSAREGMHAALLHYNRSGAYASLVIAYERAYRRGDGWRWSPPLPWGSGAHLVAGPGVFERVGPGEDAEQARAQRQAARVAERRQAQLSQRTTVRRHALRIRSGRWYARQWYARRLSDEPLRAAQPGPLTPAPDTGTPVPEAPAGPALPPTQPAELPGSPEPASPSDGDGGSAAEQPGGTASEVPAPQPDPADPASGVPTVGDATDTLPVDGLAGDASHPDTDAVVSADPVSAADGAEGDSAGSEGPDGGGAGGDAAGSGTPPEPDPDPAPEPEPEPVTASGLLEVCGDTWCLGPVTLDAGSPDVLAEGARSDVDGDGKVESRFEELSGLAGRAVRVTCGGGSPCLLLTVDGHAYR